MYELITSPNSNKRTVNFCAFISSKTAQNTIILYFNSVLLIRKNLQSTDKYRIKPTETKTKKFDQEIGRFIHVTSCKTKSSRLDILQRKFESSNRRERTKRKTDTHTHTCTKRKKTNENDSEFNGETERNVLVLACARFPGIINGQLYTFISIYSALQSSSFVSGAREI